MSIEQLNETFGIAGHVHFVEGRGGLTMIDVANGQAQATISTYAGQVLSFKPRDSSHDLLFVSDDAYFIEGNAIRGGIPICWPWFGRDPEGRPAHGFARIWQWQVIATDALADGSTRVKLGIADNADTRAIWPRTFNLFLHIGVGETLKLELITRNAGDRPFSITQAFHTYFKVSDVGRAKVLGLEDTRFVDKLGQNAEDVQSGPVTVSGEVDRIYRGVTRDLIVDDVGLNRRVHIRSTGSTTSVVWNPWLETASSMADLADEDYKRMLCVETANAWDDIVEVPAQSEVSIGVEYQLEV